MIVASEARVLDFDFPLPENLGNSRLHWALKHQRKERFWELCDNRVLARINPPRPERPLEKVEAQISMRTYRRADPDNAVARTKWIWDWLRSRGYLVDDNSARLSLTTTLQTVPRSEVGVFVRLTEVVE